MKSNYSIKNFRCFDNNGVTVQIEPITILTGGNSSGKSSIVKSILLLTDYLNSAVDMRRYSFNFTDFESLLTSTRLDFSKYPNNLLGNFEKVINNNTESGLISYRYSQHSKALNDDIYVELSFSLLESDDMKDGWLSSLQIEDSNGNIICKAHNDAGVFVYDYVNLFTLKPLFMIHSAINNLAYLERYKDSPESSPRKHNEEQISFLKNYLREKGVAIENDSLSSVRARNIYYHDNPTAAFIKKDLIFYHNLLEDFDSKSKEDTIELLTRLANKTKDPAIAKLTTKICSDFSRSNYFDFIEYYRAKENEALVFSGNKEPKRNSKYRPPLFLYYTEIPITTPGKRRDFQDDNIPFEGSGESPITIGDIFGYFLAISVSNSSRSIRNEYLGFIERRLYESFSEFSYSIIRNSVFADFAEDFNYASSTRADVRRLYALENKDDFSLLLRRFFDAKRQFFSNGLKKTGYNPGDFINKWIKLFGIGKAIHFNANRDGLGVALSVIKENGSNNILAEEGYGITQLFSILLQIEVSVIETIIAKKSEIEYPYVTIAIEEPEIHLHPKYQSLLADVFVDAYTSYNIHFIIETHSEYLIRHTQYIVAKNQYSSQEILERECPFKVYYFPTGAPAYDMKFQPNGKFVESFGEGFLDESDKWVMKMFEQDW